MVVQELPGLADVQGAGQRLGTAIHRTPLLSSRSVGEVIGASAYLKTENLQRTGSFKVRGALNAVAALSAERSRRGIVTMSAGNHAQAVAFAARTVGTSVTVVMPESAPQTKVDATRGYGAEVVFGRDLLSLKPIVDRLREERGLHFIHPYDDPDVIAGQGTVAIEIIEDLPEVDVIVVPVGGGGLISGIALACASLRPQCRVIGVEPEGAPSLRAALDAGHPVRLTSLDTIADGLAAAVAGDLTLSLVQRYVADVILVADEAMREAMTLLASRARLVVEPSGAAGVAALMSGRLRVAPGAKVAVLLTGGNVDMKRFAALVS